MTLVYVYKFSYSSFGENKLTVGVEVGSSFKIAGLFIWSLQNVLLYISYCKQYQRLMCKLLQIMKGSMF